MKASIFKRRPIFETSLVLEPDESRNDESFFSRRDETFRRRAAEEVTREKEDVKLAVKEDINTPLDLSERSEDSERQSKRVRLSQGEPVSDLRISSNNSTKKSTLRLHSLPGAPLKIRPEYSQPKLALGGSEISRESPKSHKKSYSGSLSDKIGQQQLERPTILDPESSGDESHPRLINIRKVEEKEETNIKEVRSIEIRSTEVEEAEETDPELTEISRRAREKARTQHSGRNTSSLKSLNTLQSLLTEDYPKNDSSGIGILPQKTQSDPIISYYIQSKMSNSKPLIMTRKFSQRLKEVRLHWCREQGFSEELSRKVLLTFKRARVWDTTSCKGLGFDILEGVIVKRDDPHESWDNKIFLEAMTSDDFDKLEDAKMRQRNGEQVEEQPALQEEVKDDSIRLIFKSRGHEDYKCKVRLHHKVSRVLKAFRVTYALPDEKDVSIMFDGERLNPESLFADHDLEDLDVLDVSVAS